ncbi:hypothetical protein C7E13_21950, partial [Stenotrophomonas maltophilia]
MPPRRTAVGPACAVPVVSAARSAWSPPLFHPGLLQPGHAGSDVFGTGLLCRLAALPLAPPAPCRSSRPPDRPGRR